MRKLAQSELMHDLARLGIPVIVLLRSLEGPEHLESGAREVGINKCILQRNDQAVTPEQGNKPGNACGRRELHVIRPLDRQTERGHVLYTLTE